MGFFDALAGSSIFWWFVASLIGGAVLFAWYMGVFHTLVFDRNGSVGPITFLYRLHTGPYQNVGRVFDEVEAILETKQITTLCGLGLYFDNPHVIKPQDCRSYCGYSVDPKDMERAGTAEWLTSVGLSVKRIPRTNAVTVDFPYRNTWSFIVSVMRVYGAARKEKCFDAADGAGPCASIEMYMPRPPLSKLTFAFPLENLDQFRIPAPAGGADAAAAGGVDAKKRT